MEVDEKREDGGELKIKGQAEAEKRKNEDTPDTLKHKMELEKREHELKEKALRNKVVRSRKNAAG
ncbi:hypothetical protein GLOTRDRAFT_101250 [Gloeophyllum trabeum ATCC 11539]|uniref:Uncharacterized protein n=1 Tax=Gloeophyllum trabeum (strain ATCC 11539 / FP-39264 / Madison 617) TaxID=670483 RepID=S7RDI5_GLOTA|nr:uncharacterized protein GLOTRDRAFT_101250 [Gloeophyllum trabeum ATCC 11539]EPQ52280.1 hypothetical protein GLOTRDRAFT_101250 [Gloeophyllum trabeum ATCC 11539]